jgi:hypothetical protein
MRRYYLFAATFSLALLTSPLLAQQKTASACIGEWRAAKADFQKKGITEKAYVKKCRGSTETTQASPEKNRSAADKSREKTRSAAGPAVGTKTAKVCRDEWRADKAGFQAKGVTEQSYITQCRGNPSASTGNNRANNSPSAEKPSNSRWTDIFRPRETTGTRSEQNSRPRNEGQFQSEAAAKARCSGDTVVWANLNSKIYHFAGKKAYGTTKNGAFMCEREATTQGMRASKSEDRPGS